MTMTSRSGLDFRRGKRNGQWRCAFSTSIVIRSSVGKVSSWDIGFEISVRGVSETSIDSNFGREARCCHAASDNEESVLSSLKRGPSRWMTSESTKWIGVEGFQPRRSRVSKYVVGRRGIVVVNAISPGFNPSSRKFTDTRHGERNSCIGSHPHSATQVKCRSRGHTGPPEVVRGSRRNSSLDIITQMEGPKTLIQDAYFWNLADSSFDGVRVSTYTPTPQWKDLEQSGVPRH